MFLMAPRSRGWRFLLGTALLCGSTNLAASAPAGASDDPPSPVQRLQRWMQENGATISGRLEARYSEERGNEFFAASEVAADEELVSIPLSLVVTMDRATAASPLAADVAAAWKPLPKKPAALRAVAGESYWEERLSDLQELAGQSQVALAAFLLDHWHRGNASMYADWLEVVPKDYPSCPTLWTPEELACLATLEEASITSDKQKRWLEEYQTLVHWVPKMREFSYSAFARARVSVESRTYSVLAGSPAVEHTAMVPFADLLNHEAAPRVLWTSKATSTGGPFRIVAAAAVQAGAALPGSYGKKSHQDHAYLAGYELRQDPPTSDLTEGTHTYT
eukprot:TRINITY_DN18202_c0_g1_i3.p1 TRINITY_DN18202_c0_g1~~TRINITY_DN18202_c0_g1_i3.p1  ORF type:complete len:335 (-),score=63.90 TRINITY_DN18202_c0_g1_i3:852-1856(-)